MATPINTIYSWFETGDFPTQAQFQASWSSFWHKDEKIPMGSIDGLSDQFGKYVLGSTFNSHLNDENAHSTYLAKIDASNLTPTNVNDWKAKLGVGDLPENIATYDYDIHNHVMMKDGTIKEAADLGKNIANSSLASIAGSGMTLGAPYTWNAANQPFSITGLPDNSADATFDRIRVQNSLGQESLVTNPYNVLKKGFSVMSATQALELGQLLNGGIGSAGGIGVSAIAPSVLELENNDVTLLVYGANLLLNTTSFSISICNQSGVELTQIPNGQITFIDSSSLKFYFNFNTLGVGKYKLKITSGAKVLLTTYNFEIVASVEYIETNLVTWDVNSATDYTNTLSLGSGSSFFYKNEKFDKISATSKLSIKSSKLFNIHDNFYLELKITVSESAGTNLFRPRIQVCYDNAINTLADYGLISCAYGAIGGVSYSNLLGFLIEETYVSSLGVGSPPRSAILTIVKQGNILLMRMGNIEKHVTVANNNGYSLSLQIPYVPFIDSFSINITKAYKFN